MTQSLGDENQLNAIIESIHQFIKEMCRAGTEITKSYASLNDVLSSIFGKLVDCVVQNNALHDMISSSLAQFGIASQYESHIDREQQPSRAFFDEAGNARLPLTFNLILLKRIASAILKERKELPSGRVVSGVRDFRSPSHKRALERPSFLISGRSGIEGEGHLAEIEQEVSLVTTRLHDQIESKLMPTTKAMIQVQQQYTRKTPLPNRLPLADGSTRLRVAELGESSSQREASPKIEFTRGGLMENRSADPSALPSFKKEGVISESMGVEELGMQVVANVPEIVFTLQAQMLTSLETLTPNLLQSRLMIQLSEQIAPSLGSWIYGESEELRKIGFTLSFVPVAVSEAQSSVTELLTQPLSVVDNLGSLQGERSPGDLSANKRKVQTKSLTQANIRRFVSSNLISYERDDTIDFNMPLAEQTHQPEWKGAQLLSPDQSPTRTLSRTGRHSKLSAIVALAAAGSLIAQKLRHGSAALQEEIRSARLSYAEALAESSSSVPMGAALFEETTRSQTPLATIEPFGPQTPAIHEALPKLSSISPPIQNTVNVTFPVESTEEDLRDLESRISRIMADQIRRYYGSPKI